MSPLLGLLAAAPAWAVPFTFTSQGRVVDAVEQPLEGMHVVRFALYDHPTGGTEVWSESETVAFEAGTYTTVLGRSVPLDTLDLAAGPLWLAVTVDQGTEMQSRQALTSVPYAVLAEAAASLRPGSVADVAGLKVDGQTVIDADGRISFTSLTDVPVLLSDLACSAGDLPTWDGARWACGDLAAHHHDAGDLATGVLDVARLPLGTDHDEVARGDHRHDATDLTTGTISISRLPVGSDPGDVAPGVHTHDANALVTGKVAFDRLPVGATSATVAAGLHTHAAGDLVSGKLAAAVIPFGTTAGTVAAGDHTHAYAALTGAVPFAAIPVGATATTVSRGDHTHAYAALTGAVPFAAIPVGTSSTTVSRGDHGHAAAAITGLPEFGPMVLRLELDEPGGTLLADDSGYGNDAVPTGVASLGQTGRTGKAVAFGGGALVIAAGNTLPDGPRVSVDLWAKATSVSGTQTLAEKDDAWSLRLEGPKAVFEVTTALGICQVASQANVPTSTWTSISGWYNERTVGVRVGEVVRELPCTEGAMVPTAGSALTVGRGVTGSAPLTGMIDGLRVWTTAPDPSPPTNYAFCSFTDQGDYGMSGTNHRDNVDANLDCLITSSGRPLAVEYCVGWHQSGGSYGGLYAHLWLDDAQYADPGGWDYSNPQDDKYRNTCGQWVIAAPTPGAHKVEIRPYLHHCNGSCTYSIGRSTILVREL